MAASIAQNNYNLDIEESSSHNYDDFIEYSIASTPDAHESDVSRLRSELTEKNLLLLETRSHAMSSEAQLRTELARKNAELAQSNSEIRRLKSTQGRDRYAAPSSLEVKTLNPIEEDAKELRKRVKVAWKQISAMQKQLIKYEKKITQHDNREKLATAQLEVANAEINHLKHQLQESTEKRDLLSSTMSTRLSRVEQDCSRLRTMAMSKSSEIAELEGRLNEALMALETSRADTRMAMTAAKKSQTDEQKLLEIQNKYEGAKEQIALYEKRMAEQAKRISVSVSLREKLTAVNAKYEKEKENSLNLKNVLGKTENNLLKFRKSVTEMKDRLKVAEKVSEEYRKVTFEKERLETLYNEEQRKYEKMAEHSKRLESDLAEITSIGNGTAEATTLAASSSRADSIMAQTGETDQHLQNLMQKLKLENTGLEKELFDTKKALRQCQEKISRLESSNSTYQESLQKYIRKAKTESQGHASVSRLFEDGNDNGNNLLSTFVLIFHLQKTLEKIMNGLEVDEDDVLEDNIELLSQEFNLSGKTDADLYRNRLIDFNKNIRRLHKSIVEKYALNMGVGECVSQ